MPDHSKVAIPAARSRLSSLKTRRRLVLGALIAAAVAGLLAAAAWLTYTPPAVKPPASVAASSVALATQVARDYLAGKPTTVSVAKGVDPTFGYATNSSTAPVAFPVASGPTVQGVNQTTVGTQRVNQVTFYVVLTQTPPVDPAKPDEKPVPAQVPYLLTVPMSLSDTAGMQPALAADPTLAPFTAAPDETLTSAALTAVDGAVDGSALPAPATTQLKNWAEKFAAAGKTADATANVDLKQITGDENPDRFYPGLGGWTVSSFTIQSAAPAPPAPEGQTNWFGGYVARVSLVLAPPAANGPSVRSEYDVWVAQTGTADNPPVVAWAPSGTYSQMQPYMNAIPTG